MEGKPPRCPLNICIYIYIDACMRRKSSEKSKEGGVLRSGDGEERRGGGGLPVTREKNLR